MQVWNHLSVRMTSMATCQKLKNTGKESRIIFPSKFEGIFLMGIWMRLNQPTDNSFIINYLQLTVQVKMLWNYSRCSVLRKQGDKFAWNTVINLNYELNAMIKRGGHLFLYTRHCFIATIREKKKTPVKRCQESSYSEPFLRLSCGNQIPRNQITI